MSLTATSLNGAVAQNAQTIKLTSSTGVAVGMLALVDGEKMLISDVSLAPTVSVVRGYDGTAAVAHVTLAPAVFGLTTDFLTPTGVPFNSIAADGAITIPSVDQVLYIVKATAAALTLADPPKDSQVTLTIYSQTAAAHTVTYTAGFYADTTSSDVATFAAKNGASMTIQAKKGTWGVIALANVTLA